MRQREGPRGRRDARSYLLDMQEAASFLYVAAGGKTLAEYAQDAILRSAVERQFIIIGEALVQLLRLEFDLQGRITHARRIVAFRNILVHGYADIADEIVCSALQVDLPILQREVTDLLTEMRGTEA